MILTLIGYLVICFTTFGTLNLLMFLVAFEEKKGILISLLLLLIQIFLLIYLNPFIIQIVK